MPDLNDAARALLTLAAFALAACGGRAGETPAPPSQGPVASPVPAAPVGDPHSYARPDEVAVSRLDLDLTVEFGARRLAGSATLGLERKGDADRVILDTRQLDVSGVTLVGGAGDGQPAVWELGPADPILGRALTVRIAPDTRAVRVAYATLPEAAALQWLEPSQTAGGRRPFLFTQSQAILARTWVPCQDTPAVRFPYAARVRVPPDLMALMSAENPRTRSADGVYTFSMPQPIPSYLLALAVGDLAFRALDERSGVYAEPAVVEAAAWEFADTPKMIAAAEALYGPYRWGRYDLLVLPPSFPFGGMENPRLTFLTPTLIAGDRSLVSLVAHELAHSWSGNLVTNATWHDYWLNEGFTTYFEGRIMESVFGTEYAEMIAALGEEDLRATVAGLGVGHPDTRLALDLTGRDPDDGMSDVAYEKGRSFLNMLEDAVGRDRFDAFLHGYFETYAFQPMTSDRFLAHLDRSLLSEAEARALGVDEWVHGTGLPANLPEVRSARFAAVEREAQAFQTGRPAAALATAGWTTHEWVRFLRALPDDLTVDRLAELDAAFQLTATGNGEIATAWFLKTIPAGYEPARPALEKFLLTVGRRKFLAPLYGALAKTEEGRAWGREVYERAKAGYHSVSRGTVEGVLGIGAP